MVNWESLSYVLGINTVKMFSEKGKLPLSFICLKFFDSFLHRVLKFFGVMQTEPL